MRELWPFLHCSGNHYGGHRWIRNMYVSDLKAWYSVCEFCHCHRFHSPAGGSALYSPDGTLRTYMILRSGNFNPHSLEKVLRGRLQRP